jgi:predicted RNA-binding Zn-ribbon protein involved in translation (DUF1610 family)
MKMIKFNLTKEEKEIIREHVLFTENTIDGEAVFFEANESANDELRIFQSGFSLTLDLTKHDRVKSICEKRGFLTMEKRQELKKQQEMYEKAQDLFIKLVQLGSKGMAWSTDGSYQGNIDYATQQHPTIDQIMADEYGNIQFVIPEDVGGGSLCAYIGLFDDEEGHFPTNGSGVLYQYKYGHNKFAIELSNLMNDLEASIHNIEPKPIKEPETNIKPFYCPECGALYLELSKDSIAANPTGSEIAAEDAFLKHISGDCPNSHKHDYVETCPECGKEIGRWDAYYAAHHDIGLETAVTMAIEEHMRVCEAEWIKWRVEVRKIVARFYISKELGDFIRSDFNEDTLVIALSKHMPQVLKHIPTPPNYEFHQYWPWLWIDEKIPNIENIRKRIILRIINITDSYEIIKIAADMEIKLL